MWFALANQELHIGVEANFAPARKAHAAFDLGSAEDLDVLRRRLASDGIAIEEGQVLTGVRRFYTADPWGNRLEFLVRE